MRHSYAPHATVIIICAKHEITYMSRPSFVPDRMSLVTKIRTNTLSGAKLSDGHVAYDWPPAGYICEGEIFAITSQSLMCPEEEFCDVEGGADAYGDGETVRDTPADSEHLAVETCHGQQLADAGGVHHGASRDLDFGQSAGSVHVSEHAKIEENSALLRQREQDDDEQGHEAPSQRVDDALHIGQLEEAQQQPVQHAVGGPSLMEVAGPPAEVAAIVDFMPWLKDSIEQAPEQAPVALQQQQPDVVQVNAELGRLDSSSLIAMASLDSAGAGACRVQDGTNQLPEPVAAAHLPDDAMVTNHGHAAAGSPTPHYDPQKHKQAPVVESDLNVWGSDDDDLVERRNKAPADGDMHVIDLTHSEASGAARAVPQAQSRDSQDPELLKVLQLSLLEQQRKNEQLAAAQAQADEELWRALQLSQADGDRGRGKSGPEASRRESEDLEVLRVIEMSIRDKDQQDLETQRQDDERLALALQESLCAGVAAGRSDTMHHGGARACAYGGDAEAGMSPRERHEDDMSWKREVTTPAKRGRSSDMDALELVMGMFPDYDAVVVEQVDVVCPCPCVIVFVFVDVSAYVPVGVTSVWTRGLVCLAPLQRG